MCIFALRHNLQTYQQGQLLPESKYITKVIVFCVSEPEESSISSEYSQYRGQVRSHLFRKAKRKALRMSVVIVAAFIICWSPYYVVFMYFTFLDLREMPRKTMLPLAFIGLSNSLINPMIYGAFQLCKVHSPRSVRPYVRTLSMPFQYGCMYYAWSSSNFLFHRLALYVSSLSKTLRFCTKLP